MDGTDYTSDSLYGLVDVVCLQLYMDSVGKQYKFLTDDAFLPIKNSLDNTMKSRARGTSNIPRKQAEIIALEEEDKLWSNGVLGSDTPKQLVNTLLYSIGLSFALRGGQEHRDLRCGVSSQLKLGSDDHGRFLSYTEDVSKCNQGGIKHRKCKPKSVVAYENKSAPERCVVMLFEKYLSHRPLAKSDSEPFYIRPLERPSGDVWYSRQAIGRHNLASTVSNMCKVAGLTGFRSNHSLRASAATRLFDAGVDEQLICEVTGHRSNAVRSYKRTNSGQKRTLSRILQVQNEQEEMKKRKDIVNTDDGNVSITVTVNVSK